MRVVVSRVLVYLKANDRLATIHDKVLDAQHQTDGMTAVQHDSNAIRIICGGRKFVTTLVHRGRDPFSQEHIYATMFTSGEVAGEHHGSPPVADALVEGLRLQWAYGHPYTPKASPRVSQGHGHGNYVSSSGCFGASVSTDAAPRFILQRSTAAVAPL